MPPSLESSPKPRCYESLSVCLNVWYSSASTSAASTTAGEQTRTPGDGRYDQTSFTRTTSTWARTRWGLTLWSDATRFAVLLATRQSTRYLLGGHHSLRIVSAHRRASWNRSRRIPCSSGPGALSKFGGSTTERYAEMSSLAVGASIDARRGSCSAATRATTLSHHTDHWWAARARLCVSRSIDQSGVECSSAGGTAGRGGTGSRAASRTKRAACGSWPTLLVNDHELEPRVRITVTTIYPLSPSEIQRRSRQAWLLSMRPTVRSKRHS